ncbi:MAG: hypothetical protein WAV05_11235 [Anaerolineales bacterium]
MKTDDPRLMSASSSSPGKARKHEYGDFSLSQMGEKAIPAGQFGENINLAEGGKAQKLTSPTFRV